MAEIKDIKDARRKRNSQKMIKRLIVFAVLICVIIGAVFIKETVSRENFTAAISDFFSSMGKGNGYPVTVPGSQSVDVSALSGGAAVLTQTQFIVYSDSGKELISTLHGFSNPLMTSVKNRTLVYDRGGTGIKVFSKTKQLFTKAFDNVIYGAFMGKKYIAVVTASQTHSCEVVVFTSSYKEIMKWYCADGRVTAISFDEGASKIYASVVDAEDGDFVTTVYKLDVSKKAEEASVKIGAMLALSMKENGSGTEIIGQDRIVNVSSDMTVSSVYEYGENSLSSFAFESNGKTVLALSEGENDKANNIVILKSGKEESIILSVDDEVEAIELGSKYLYYISGEKVYAYSFKTGESRSIEVDIDTFAIAAEGNDIFALGVTKISKLNSIYE